MAPPANYTPEIREQLGRLEARMDTVVEAVERLTARDAEHEKNMQNISERLGAAMNDVTTKFTAALVEQREGFRVQMEALRHAALMREDLAWVKAVATVTVTAILTATAEVWIPILIGHHG